MEKLILIIAALLSTAASARTAVSKATIDTLAGQYYASQRFNTIPAHAPQDCLQNPTGPSCVDVACDLLGRFGCDDLSQVESVGRACRGNYDGTCVKSSCAHLGRFGCDDLAEVTRVAVSCKGVYSTDCIDTVCGLVGRFGCDDLVELERAGTMCRGADSSCIKSVCARLGRFGCDDLAEVERVAASCGGN